MRPAGRKVTKGGLDVLLYGMNEHPLQATIMDVVPLGRRLLLSVRGLGRRPALPAEGLVVQTGDRTRLLDQPHSPTM